MPKSILSDDLYAKQKAKIKLSEIAVIEKTSRPSIPKPDWIRIRLSPRVEIQALKEKLRAHRLVTVCEEAACPNLPECFGKGTATFMIMGDICTRRCSFCNVGQGKPHALNENEPAQLADTIHEMGLAYVVITSVDRDDLKDGGASHFARCIAEIRKKNKNIKIEILTPDFQSRIEPALQALSEQLPDVFNHNIETVPRLYKKARPGAHYDGSLSLLKQFKKQFPAIPTKSGMMLGLGETDTEVEQVMLDLRDHNVDRLTLGQYLQPSPYHLEVDRYVPPDRFRAFADLAQTMGFLQVASGPLVRSSYHADKQDSGEKVY